MTDIPQTYRVLFVLFLFVATPLASVQTQPADASWPPFEHHLQYTERIPDAGSSINELSWKPPTEGATHYTPTFGPASPPEDTAAARQVGQKSPALALLYSLGGTVAPSSLWLIAGHNSAVASGALVAGLLAGPSLGHFYAGDSRQAWIGLGLRGAGAAGFVLGFPLAWEGNAVGPALFYGGLALSAGSLVYDIVTAWDSAQDYNEELAARLRVAPTVGPQARQVGLAFQVEW